MNPLTSYGLATQGADMARNVQQEYETGQARLGAMNQQSQLTGQQIQAGQMGLDEAKQAQDAQTAARKAGASSLAAGGTMSGSLIDMANTYAKAGRMDEALKYRQAHDALEAMGGPAIVHAAVTGAAGDRPDIVNIMNQYEATKGVTQATLDNTGKLTVVRNGQPAPIDIKQMGELLGIFKSPKVESVAPGATGFLTGPGIDPRLPQNQIKTDKPFQINRQHDYGEMTTADGAKILVDLRPTKEDGTPNPGFQKPVTGSIPVGASVRKEMPVLTDIHKAVADLGEKYASVDMSGLTPNVKPTPLGNKTIMIANQLLLGTKDSGKDYDPHTLVEMASKGEAIARHTADGKFVGNFLKYKGQLYPLRTPEGAPDAAAAPAASAPAAPAAAPAAPPIVPVGGTPAIAPPVPAAPPAAEELIPRQYLGTQVNRSENPQYSAFISKYGAPPPKFLGSQANRKENPAYTEWSKKVIAGMRGSYASGGKVSRHGLG